MSWTQSDVDAIDTALKRGTSEVRYADRSVKYSSVDELRKVRALAVQQVSIASAAVQGGSSRYSVADFTE